MNTIRPYHYEKIYKTLISMRLSSWYRYEFYYSAILSNYGYKTININCNWI